MTQEHKMSTENIQVAPGDEIYKKEDLAKAEALLEQFIRENEANGWPGIDRTPEGYSKRLYHHRWGLGNEALEGYPPPEPGSLSARQADHWVNGNITAEQSVIITRTACGLNND